MLPARGAAWHAAGVSTGCLLPLARPWGSSWHGVACRGLYPDAGMRQPGSGMRAWVRLLLALRWTAGSACPAWASAEPQGSVLSVARGALAGRACSVAGRRALCRRCEGGPTRCPQKGLPRVAAVAPARAACLLALGPRCSEAGVPAILGVPERSQGLL